MLFFGRRHYRTPSSKARFSQRVAHFFSFILATGFILIVVAALGFIVWGIHGFLFRSDYFSIRRVAIVEGLDDLESSERENLDDLMGDFENLRLALRSRLRKAGLMEGNLLALETSLVEGIVQGHSEVEACEADKQYPGFLEIRVRRRTPVALIPHDPLLSLEESVWAIDAGGYVVRRLTTEEPLAAKLPYISGVDTRDALKDGRLLSESLTRALRLLSLVKRGAPSLWRDVSEIRVENGVELTLMLMGGTEFRFLADSTDALTRQLAALDEFLSTDPRQPEIAAYIDLRVQGQVAWLPKDAVDKRQ